jgi:diguanylate cyclase (GGDEF)-like protein
VSGKPNQNRSRLTLREREPLRDEADPADRTHIEQRTREAVMGGWKVAHEALLHSAQADDLTGAYRREAGRRALAAEVDRARRADGRLVVAFVDVDGLKQINDREGHAAGDQILQAVAQTLRAKLRSYDPIVRYGGDEFVCGLGGISRSDAEVRFVAVAAALETVAGVAVSIGLAALGEGDTADDLVQRADLRMLQVKSRRRSRQAG